MLTLLLATCAGLAGVGIALSIDPLAGESAGKVCLRLKEKESGR